MDYVKPGKQTFVIDEQEYQFTCVPRRESVALLRVSPLVFRQSDDTQQQQAAIK
jgi:hypothetical protein